MSPHCIMHVPFEGPGYVEEWFLSKGQELKIWPLYKEPVLPHPEDVDFLVIMGGTMNIYETDLYPWLETERSLLQSCLDRGTRMLGICLGAQLLADLLGKKIYPCSHKEIGWFPLTLDRRIRSHSIFRTLPETMNAFHWHGETFDLPEGSIHIGSTEACPNQGFLYNQQVMALQFHLEVTAGILEELIQNCSHELDGSVFVQDAAELVKGLQNGPKNREILFGMLDDWLGDISTSI